jgi:regulator of PEP synthase PpsR (kinase-PPPase family)
VLKGYFSEAMKAMLDDKKIAVECRSSHVKGTFNVWLTNEMVKDVNAPLVPEPTGKVIHSKHDKTNGFGLFTNKEHVQLLKTKLEEAIVAF